mgnify:CR=1 FL=1
MAGRVNRAIELLGQDQAIYYDGPHSGHVLTYEQGRKDAATWADYMNVGMEHGSFDMAGLAEYLRGMVAGGPARSRHRTPAVIVEAPVNGTDEANVRFNAWQFGQILGRGVHGILLCNDKMSMGASLELRVPFLDLELMRFVERIPARVRVRPRAGKRLHRRAMELLLPAGLADRPKHGFSTPYDDWLRRSLGQEVERRYGARSADYRFGYDAFTETAGQFVPRNSSAAALAQGLAISSTNRSAHSSPRRAPVVIASQTRMPHSGSFQASAAMRAACAGDGGCGSGVGGVGASA